MPFSEKGFHPTVELRRDVGEPGGHPRYLALAGAVEPDVTSIAAPAPVHGPGGEIGAAMSLLAPSCRSPQARALGNQERAA